MEGLALTLLLVIGMIAAIVLLGRSWPRSSRLGGYRAKRDGGDPTVPDEAPVREDDDARWNWSSDDGEKPREPDR